MATLNMEGSYPFTSSEIDLKVSRKSPGNYALGYSNNGTFYIKYVGRSDSDVNAELKNRLDPKYARFMFSYATSAKDAYEKECKNYHDFGERQSLDNKVHPDKPNGTYWKCPVCGA